MQKCKHLIHNQLLIFFDLNQCAEASAGARLAMRFSSRLIFCSAAPAALFVLALLSSQWGLTRTQSDFNDYLRNNQAVVAQLQELYAQGLQSGQALRNIVMDPSDGQAVQNLGNARRAYDAAYDDLSRRVQGTAMEVAVKSLQALRQAQSEAQDQIVTAVCHEIGKLNPPHRRRDEMTRHVLAGFQDWRTEE